MVRVTGIYLHDIVQFLGGELIGDPQFLVQNLRAISDAGPFDIAFLRDDFTSGALQVTTAGCLIVSTGHGPTAAARGHCIVTPDPYLYYARLSRLWRERFGRKGPPAGIHPSAVVHPMAVVHPTAAIGPLCVIEAGATVGEYTVLTARVFIGEDCAVGAHCIFHPGVVIGADGFGFAPSRQSGHVTWEKIEQLGAVVIGDEVEIGANTCVDRGALRNTVIDSGVKLDNLIQIGHNVMIGRNTAIAACVAIAGSTVIGSHCTIGGASSIAGHLTIADNVHISGATTVIKSVQKPGQYSGVFPMDTHEQWEKNAAGLRRLDSLRERVKLIESKLNRITIQ